MGRDCYPQMRRMRTVISTLADLQAIEGKPLGATDWHTITFEEIVAFADATGDHQWIHVDRERAEKESPFGGPVAHGYWGIARIGGLFGELVDTSGCALVINYGINKARFPAAVVAGSRYRLEIQHQSTTDKGEVADAIFVAKIAIEGEDKPACVAEVVYRFAFSG